MNTIFVARGSEQLGQFSEQEIRDGLESGRFQTSDLWWKEGMEEWQPLSSFRSRSFVPVAPAPDAAPALGGTAFPLVSQSARAGIAWERSEGGIIKRWWDTTIGALFSPVTTFGEMQITGGYGAPLLYTVLSGALGGLIMGIFQVIVQAVTATATGGEQGAAAGGATLLCMLPVMVGASLVGAAIGAVFGAFVGGGITHLFLMIFGAAGKGFEATVRAVCYSSGAVNGLYLVPILGWIAAIFWAPVLYVISLKQAHQTDYWRVICALVLWLLICCGGVVGISLAFGGIFAAMSEMPVGN